MCVVGGRGGVGPHKPLASKQYFSLKSVYIGTWVYILVTKSPCCLAT